MQLTILGKNGPYAAPGGATTGYLVSSKNTNILLDCGSGTLANLSQFIAFEKLDAIVLSHLHFDHTSDLFTLSYALKHPISLYLPPSPNDEFLRINALTCYNCTLVNDGDKIKIGDIDICFFQGIHPVQSLGMRLSCTSTLAYTADTRYFDSQESNMANADILLAHSCLLESQKTPTAPHLSAQDCGLLAKKSNAKKLVLSHLHPNLNPSDVLKEAQAHFLNSVVANELMQITF